MAGRRDFHIRWVPPKPPEALETGHLANATWGLGEAGPGSLRMAPAIHADLTPVSDIQRQLRQMGHLELVTDPTNVASPLSVKDELLGFLRFAAEIEHALLVQYLYALSSFDPNEGANQQAAALVRTIALQEMAHLLTVQNLLLAVGGPDELHVGRDGMRAKDPQNPLPLSLSPITHLTIAEYVLAEMPAVPPDADKAIVDRIRNEVLTGTTTHPQRVGVVYARIYWLLQPTDEPTGPVELRPDPKIGLYSGHHLKELVDVETIKKYLAALSEWVPTGPDMLVLPTTDRNLALTAVAKVMEQGEGLSHVSESHFDKFLEVFKLFESGALKILPLPISPYVVNGPLDPGPRTLITHPYIFRWGLLFNVRYTMLMVVIGHTMATPISDPDRDTLLQGFFFPIMRDFERRNARGPRG